MKKKQISKVIAVRGCSSFGWIDVGEFCGDPNCQSCHNAGKALDKAFKEQFGGHVCPNKSECKKRDVSTVTEPSPYPEYICECTQGPFNLKG